MFTHIFNYNCADITFGLQDIINQWSVAYVHRQHRSMYSAATTFILLTSMSLLMVLMYVQDWDGFMISGKCLKTMDPSLVFKEHSIKFYAGLFRGWSKADKNRQNILILNKTFTLATVPTYPTGLLVDLTYDL